MLVSWEWTYVSQDIRGLGMVSCDQGGLWLGIFERLRMAGAWERSSYQIGFGFRLSCGWEWIYVAKEE